MTPSAPQPYAKQPAELPTAQFNQAPPVYTFTPPAAQQPPVKQPAELPTAQAPVNQAPPVYTFTPPAAQQPPVEQSAELPFSQAQPVPQQQQQYHQQQSQPMVKKGGFFHVGTLRWRRREQPTSATRGAATPIAVPSPCARWWV
eukprot:237793_1